MPAQFESDACRPQSIGGVDRVAYISKRHDCTAPRKRLGGRNAAACCTHHEHAAIPNGEVTLSHVITEASTS
jgi:hypothetical protein